jgi:hypothetical protein
MKVVTPVLTAIAAVFMLATGCGRGAPDSAFREVFAEQVPAIEAALSSADRVDTTFAQGPAMLEATAWFANGKPLAMNLTLQSSGAALLETRCYYDERGRLLARVQTSYPERRSQPTSMHHIVARTLYGAGPSVRWGEVAVDEQPVTSRAAVESSPAYEVNRDEPEILRLLLRRAGAS